MRYRLYQYVIAINHHNDEMFLIENKINGLKSELSTLENIINQKNAPVSLSKLLQKKLQI
jgi:anthranilate synthase component 1